MCFFCCLREVKHGFLCFLLNLCSLWDWETFHLVLRVFFQDYRNMYNLINCANKNKFCALIISHCTEVLSRGLTIMAEINPPESKLAKAPLCCIRQKGIFMDWFSELIKENQIYLNQRPLIILQTLQLPLGLSIRLYLFL